jgi:hypothetical protein
MTAEMLGHFLQLLVQKLQNIGFKGFVSCYILIYQSGVIQDICFVGNNLLTYKSH